jgi:hypothetical protein
MSKKSAFAAIILAFALSALTACSSVSSIAPRGAGNTVHQMCAMPQIPVCHD